MDKKQLKISTFNDALDQIKDGMILGIGSGSTIELLVPKIAEKLEREQINITGVCTYVHTPVILICSRSSFSAIFGTSNSIVEPEPMPSIIPSLIWSNASLNVLIFSCFLSIMLPLYSQYFYFYCT